MQVHKPEDALLILGHASRAGRPVLTVTVGYVCGNDGSRMPEPAAWQWLMKLFPDEPFDVGEKMPGGGFGVAGEACAPGGALVEGLTVRAGVGELHGRVLVLGDRHWMNTTTGWRASAPQPFERMPIGLARAFGGPDWRDNPYGRGHAKGGKYEGMPLPNVEHPDHPVLGPGDTPPLATLGILPMCSGQRLRWLGTIDDEWVRTRLPWLPDDTDPRWFNRLPMSQCGQSYWRGDEAWFAENMHPRLARLEGRLPGLRPRLLLRTVADPDRHIEIRADLDTVWLMPNDERVVVLYRAEMPVLREDAKDIKGLAVFTEALAESPRPLEHWSAEWRKALETEIDPAAAMPLPPALSESQLAALEAQRVQIAEEAAAFAASLKKDVEGALADAEKEAEEAVRSRGFNLEAIKARAAQSEADGPARLPPLGPMPSDPAAFRAKLQSYVENALKQGEAEARQIMEKKGFNVDAIQAYVKAHPAPEISEAEAVARAVAMLPIPAAQKAGYLDAYTAFQKDIQAMQDKLQAQFEEAEQATVAALAAMEQGRRKDADALPTGPRERLTREQLRERVQAGRSARWTELQDLDLTGLDLSGVDLRASVVRGCVFDDAVLRDADLSRAQFENCRFARAQLGAASLQGAEFLTCVLEEANLEHVVFTNSRVGQTSFDRANLQGSVWDDAQAIECAFEAALLRGASGRRALFSKCRMAAVDAAESRFEKTEFEQCVLDGARFSRACLSGSTLYACQAAMAQFDGATVPGLRSLVGTRLDQANFNGADLEGASLQNTSLTQAVLREARLDGALIKECDLSRTDAWRMVARRADFSDSQITQASWRGVNLMHATLGHARVFDTDLTGSNLHATQTRNATVQGLKLEGALMTRCRLLQEYGDGG